MLLIKDLFRTPKEYSFAALTGWGITMYNGVGICTLYFTDKKIGLDLSGKKMRNLCQKIIDTQFDRLVQKAEDSIKNLGITITAKKDIRRLAPYLFVPISVILFWHAFFKTVLFSKNFFPGFLIGGFCLYITYLVYVSRNRMESCVVSENGLDLVFNGKTYKIHWNEMKPLFIFDENNTVQLSFKYNGDPIKLSSDQFVKELGVFNYILKKVEEHHPEFR